MSKLNSSFGAFQTICSSSNLLIMLKKQYSFICKSISWASLNHKTKKLRNWSRLFQSLEGQEIVKLEGISKNLTFFGLLMSFAIFAIKEVFLYHDIEKSRGLFFNKILSNKHTAPPIFNSTKHSLGCGIDHVHNCASIDKKVWQKV